MAATPRPLQRQTHDRGGGGLASMALGCLATLAACGIVGAAVYPFLPPTPGGDPTVPRIMAAVIGLFGGLGVSSAVSVVMGYGRGTQGRAALHERARTDGPVDEGEFVIATGTVSAERPLISPLGGVPCAAYDFRMYLRTRSSSRGEEENPVYWGYAGQPFAIDSRTRRYPVASVPILAERSGPLDGDAVRQRARAYIRSTGWETVEFKLLGTIDTVFQMAGQDSTTGLRRDFAVANDEAPDLSLLQLEETVLRIGETASVFGTWSGSLGAIVAPPSPLPVTRVVVARGGPEALDGKPGVPQSTRSYIVGAIVMLLLAGGLFWLATIIIPTVKG